MRGSPQSTSNKRKRILHSNGTQDEVIIQDDNISPGLQWDSDTVSSSTLQKFINMSLVPQEFQLPVTHKLEVVIGGRVHSCPLIWIDDIFHHQTVLHHDRNAGSVLGNYPPPPPWPALLAQFYNFAVQFSVTLHDVQLQFGVVEKVRLQSSKVRQYVVLHGIHVRDITVDVHFYRFLESLELFQFLPNHPRNPSVVNSVPHLNVPHSNALHSNSVVVNSTPHSNIGVVNNVSHASSEVTVEGEMDRICERLISLVRRSQLEDGLHKLMVKCLEEADICTFILAVVNSNTVPSNFEEAVVEILGTELNLPDINNLTDLTGVSLLEQQQPQQQPQQQHQQQHQQQQKPEIYSLENMPAPDSISYKMDIQKTISSLLPDQNPLHEDVKNFILNEPLQVIEMINSLQQQSPGIDLSFESLSQVIIKAIHPTNSTPIAHNPSDNMLIKSAAHIPGVALGVASGITPGITAGVTKCVAPGIPPSLPPGTLPGAVTGVAGGAVPNLQTRPPDVQLLGYIGQGTPPGYNPRYYSPHLSPQHQQRYGRPPLRRCATNLGPIQQIPAPLIPPLRPGPRVKDIRKPGPVTLLNKAVQARPAQRTVQQQVSITLAPATSEKPKKFVDLSFFPHV